MVQLAIALFVIICIALIIWFRAKKGNRPIRGGGFGIISPLIIIAIVFSFSISQLMNIPGKPFHFPAYWELAIAGLLGALFGAVMLSQTAYEVREDGFVYSKRNKNFKYVIISIIAIRIVLSQYFKNIDAAEFTVLTMELAFVYLCIWRIGSFVKFRKISKTGL
ncbi:DUF1453 family protein [Bacillus sp. ISL-51]|uniref:CcdC protein domain-containing protein n=1 Tax=unclassified Bacillus (in: firmicutes) TaxID=185979 RepID=UPI001BE7B312|nr:MULTISPECIES: CcdC protein domain-containing protein [unclassified Bacillus (in: firmicutes)]MBT2574590.1 DUF1453 family protein [Bacillus sp. ISL-51]MBT2633405.1 DUF1453 family protein [Bacillus sp. ISL-26]